MIKYSNSRVFPTTEPTEEGVVVGAYAAPYVDDPLVPTSEKGENVAGGWVAGGWVAGGWVAGGWVAGGWTIILFFAQPPPLEDVFFGARGAGAKDGIPLRTSAITNVNNRNTTDAILWVDMLKGYILSREI